MATRAISVRERGMEEGTIDLEAGRAMPAQGGSNESSVAEITQLQRSDM